MSAPRTFWAGMAATTAAAVVIYFGASYAQKDPESIPARCCATAHALLTVHNPVYQLGQGVTRWGGQPAAGGPDVGEESQLSVEAPAEPVEAPAEPVEAPAEPLPLPEHPVTPPPAARVLLGDSNSRLPLPPPWDDGPFWPASMPYADYENAERIPGPGRVAPEK